MRKTVTGVNDSLESVLEQLLETSEKPHQASLWCLSNLNNEEEERVRDVWAQLPPDLRVEAASWLVRMAEADFTLDFSQIFRLGMEDDDERVRKTAIEGLWEEEDVRLVPYLAQCLREDDSVGVRAAAAKSLGRFVLLGELERIRSGPRQMAYEVLVEAHQAQDEDLEVQRRALESLAYVCNDTVVNSIAESYGSPVEKMRISAVFAMGRSADARWEQDVQRELYSTNPEMRYEAARACGELQVSEAVSMLEELAEDTDAEVQQTAIWALGQIGGDRARQVLEYYCSFGDEALRSAAKAAVKEFEFLHGDLEEVFANLNEEISW